MRLAFLTTCVVLSIAGLGAADDHTVFRTDAQRTGAITTESLPGTTLTMVQDWTPGGAIVSSPLLASGRCYFGTLTGGVYCYDATLGSQVWAFAAGGPIFSSPTLVAGTLYFACEDGFLYAIRASDGTQVWKVSHGGTAHSSPLVDSGLVFVAGQGTHSDGIAAYNAATGTSTWTYTFPQVSWGTPAAWNGRIYCGANDGGLYCLDEATGALQWRYMGSGPALAEAPVILAGAPGQVVYAGGSSDTSVRLLAADTGALQSTFPLPDNGTSVAWADPGALPFSDGFFYVGSSAVDGSIAYITRVQMGTSTIGGAPLIQFSSYALNLGTGTAVWQNRRNTSGQPSSICGSPVTSRIGAGPTYVFVGMADRLCCFDAATGLLAGGTGMATLVGNAFSSPACANGLVAIGTDAGHLYVFQTPNTPPIVPAGFNPAGGANYRADQNPRLSWAASTDAQDASNALVYRVEVGYDDANLDDGATISATTPAGQAFFDLAGVPFRTHVYYRVRSRDTAGAESPWSAPADFYVDRWNGPPPAVTNLTAAWGNRLVDLSWTASTDGDVVAHRIDYQVAGGNWSSPTVVNLGNVTSYRVSGLTNGTTYEFRVTPIDSDTLAGPFAQASATPGVPATVGGVNYPTIQQAVDNALPGQTVTLIAAEYDGAVILPGGVSLLGAGPGDTIVNGEGAAQTILINGNSGQPTTSISQLRVTGGVVGIVIGGAPADDPNVSLSHLVICRNTADGVFSTSLARLTGTFLTIANNGGDGLDLSMANATVYDSILCRNGGQGVRNRGAAASVTVDHSCFAGNTGGMSSGGPTITAWHQASPLFQNEAGDDYRSTFECPTVDRARAAATFAQEPSSNGGRANQGAFGDTTKATTTSGYDLTEEICLGGGRGSGGWVQLRSHRASNFAAMGWTRLPWIAYDSANGAIHPALGNVDGQAGSELVLGTCQGGWIAVMHHVGGVTSLLRWVQVPWTPYDNAVGVTWPACGDVDGDGLDEIVVGLGPYPTAGGWVAVLDDMNADFRLLRWLRLSRSAYDAASGETRVACGDVDGDGRAEIVVASGRAPGLGGFADIYDDARGNYARIGSVTHPNAAYVAASGELFPAVGDLSGDGRSEIVLGPGRGGAGLVSIFRDSAGSYAFLRQVTFPWSAYNSAQGEVRVACGNLDADARDEVLGSQGTFFPGGGRSYVWDDASASYAGVGWITYDWSAYNNANGEIFPAIGNIR